MNWVVRDGNHIEVDGGDLIEEDNLWMNLPTTVISKDLFAVSLTNVDLQTVLRLFNKNIKFDPIRKLTVEIESDFGHAQAPVTLYIPRNVEEFTFFTNQECGVDAQLCQKSLKKMDVFLLEDVEFLNLSKCSALVSLTYRGRSKNDHLLLKDLCITDLYLEIDFFCKDYPERTLYHLPFLKTLTLELSDSTSYMNTYNYSYNTDTFYYMDFLALHRNSMTDLGITSDKLFHTDAKLSQQLVANLLHEFRNIYKLSFPVAIFTVNKTIETELGMNVAVYKARKACAEIILLIAKYKRTANSLCNSKDMLCYLARCFVWTHYGELSWKSKWVTQ